MQGVPSRLIVQEFGNRGDVESVIVAQLKVCGVGGSQMGGIVLPISHTVISRLSPPPPVFLKPPPFFPLFLRIGWPPARLSGLPERAREAHGWAAVGAGVWKCG